MNRPRGGGETAGKSGDWAASGHSSWRSNKCWGQFLGKQISHLVGLGERHVSVGSCFPVRIRLSGSSVFSLLLLCQMTSFYFMVVSALESACCLCQSAEAGFISLGN